MDNVNDNSSYSKSFKCKTKMTVKTKERPAQAGNVGDTNQADDSQHQP